TVTLLQRSSNRPGARLGRSTGWILREKLARRGLHIQTGAHYEKIDDDGLHYWSDGLRRVLDVDLVVTCAGQQSRTALATALQKSNVKFDVIGGARLAAELDATRAIEEGTNLGFQL